MTFESSALLLNISAIVINYDVANRFLSYACWLETYIYKSISISIKTE